MKPDRQMKLSRHGGHFSDLPEPHVRWFRFSRRKRKVTVSIKMFCGIGTHYYVTMKEEDDYIWDSPDGIWTHPWDSEKCPGLDGRSFSTKFGNRLSAERWAAKTFLRKFGTKTHRLVNLFGQHTSPKWFGQYKEGD